MDKETLSNYGWVVICILVLVCFLAMATPFGNFIATAVKQATEGLFKTSENALNRGLSQAAGITIAEPEEIKFDTTIEYNGIEGNTGNEGNKPVTPEENNGKVIPEGGKYITKDGTQLHPGENMPETVNSGDILITKDYEYHFNQYFANGWSSDASQNGWGVRVRNVNQVTYEPLMETINGKPLKNMYGTFSRCEKMVNAPSIPESVTNLHAAFDNCTSLVTAPVIPKNVTNMMSTFHHCISLKGNVTVNATELQLCLYCFLDCGETEANTITLSGTSSSLNDLKASGGRYIKIK